MVTKTAAYGALHAFLAVALGAFAAHGLKETLDSDMLAVFETGVRYHMYHALGLLLIGLLTDRLGPVKLIIWSGRLLHIGIILFSGSLYALSLTGLSWFGPITPLGGIAFLAGWAAAAVAVWKARTR
jgi:uncharacterized membrane protein YgdD (TMEM256/DUF423 family)